uniref:Uncharacterized protein n=1 Tax=uncultured Chromatiales bacterium HF0200_41F04 TaxID=710740 RepID=E0XV45_9GAMM|nr:hypothetical protein [uncultured Chromatiales bacterium HF0200_41F04]
MYINTKNRITSVRCAYSTFQIFKEQTTNELEVVIVACSPHKAESRKHQDRAKNLRIVAFYFQLNLVELGGIEPPTPCLQSRCSPS